MDQDDGFDWTAHDEAVSRLEDHILKLPYDRALPPVPTLLTDAGVPRSLLRTDERARKIVREAILARPLSDADDVAARSAEIELLVLEVGVLADELRAARKPDADEVATARGAAAASRLLAIRSRLRELRQGL